MEPRFQAYGPTAWRKSRVSQIRRTEQQESAARRNWRSRPFDGIIEAWWPINRRTRGDEPPSAPRDDGATCGAFPRKSQGHDVLVIVQTFTLVDVRRRPNHERKPSLPTHQDCIFVPLGSLIALVTMCCRPRESAHGARSRLSNRLAGEVNGSASSISAVLLAGSPSEPCIATSSGGAQQLRSRYARRSGYDAYLSSVCRANSTVA